MLHGLGPTQSASRLGSSPSIPIRSAEVAEVTCPDRQIGLVGASPTGKKKGSLLKSLKRIGIFLSGNLASSAGAGDVRPDSDPLQNGLAHALSTPELPSTAPVSLSASPSPSYMDMARNQRLGSILRAGGSGSPPAECHSPCSPFPSAGRGIFKRDSDFSSQFDTSIRCNVRKCSPAAVAVVSSSQLQRENSTNPSSPMAIASPQADRALSPYGSGSSVYGRLEKMSDASSCSSSAAPSPPAAPETPPAAASSTSSFAQPPPNTTLLALNPAVPAAMARRSWCLEDYQVVKRLYKGGSASVYKAVCLRSGLTVALKVYFLTRVPRNVLHMVKREIELHHQLVHPNIIQLYAAFLDCDRIVLVQEYAARGDLFHLLRQMGGRMTETQVSELVMKPFLDATAYLHSLGICHRDVKPENILYNEQWVLKIADFGVSINLNDERAVTRAGTIDYMAPEVTRCPLKAEPGDNKENTSLAYTSAVDIWAAGVLTYELLVGFTPVVAPSPSGGRPPRSGAMGNFMETEARSSALHFPASLSGLARQFIQATLSDNPGDRPTAKELQKHAWIVVS